MKIYTRTGDRGETSLVGGRRVKKNEKRVEAYGSVDELNAHVGWAGTHLAHLPLEEEIREIQSDLFTLGADLATPPESPIAGLTARIDEERVKRLEDLIDRWEAQTEPVRNFILPGGAPGAAALQVCRAVCRRAERYVVRLSLSEAVNPQAIVYLNRLSDLFFVLSRWVNTRDGVPESIWKRSEV